MTENRVGKNSSWPLRHLDRRYDRSMVRGIGLHHNVRKLLVLTNDLAAFHHHPSSAHEDKVIPVMPIFRIVRFCCRCPSPPGTSRFVREHAPKSVDHPSASDRQD